MTKPFWEKSATASREVNVTGRAAGTNVAAPTGPPSATAAKPTVAAVPRPFWEAPATVPGRPAAHAARPAAVDAYGHPKYCPKCGTGMQAHGQSAFICPIDHTIIN
jgi:hypothetical protein